VPAYVARLAPPGGNIPGVALKKVPAVRVKAVGPGDINRIHAANSTRHALTKHHSGIGFRCEPHGNWRKSMPTKTRERKAGAGKVNALQKPLQPSEELAAVIGSGPLPRGQVVSKMWEYIRSHNLQNPENRREILADDKLRRVFGKDKVTMFEMTSISPAI
jgi:chromatin remodeling complex protein RSC6